MFLTQSEKRIFIIIITVILIAAGIQIFNSESIPAPNIDYSESDSLFSRLSHVRQESFQNNYIQQKVIYDDVKESIPSSPVKIKKNLTININTATEKDFTQLPRIGPAIAKRIINYRTSFGLFKSNDDLQKIKGIGPKTLKKIKPFLQNID
jgi:comEA protein